METSWRIIPEREIIGYESWSIMPTATKKSPAEKSPLSTRKAANASTIKYDRYDIRVDYQVSQIAELFSVQVPGRGIAVCFSKP